LTSDHRNKNGLTGVTHNSVILRSSITVVAESSDLSPNLPKSGAAGDGLRYAPHGMTYVTIQKE